MPRVSQGGDELRRALDSRARVARSHLDPARSRRAGPRLCTTGASWVGTGRGDARVSVTPVQLCGGLLSALDASEGRRRRRSRNTTADSIGLSIQRSLLEEAVREGPSAEEFERWLQRRCVAQGESDGSYRAMALLIWHEWQLASQMDDVSAWLTSGARSDDREGVDSAS